MTREEAIKIIESNCSCTDSKLREACAMFIPELAESEDEKIRKVLLNLVSNDKANGYTDFYDAWGITCDDAIAYLERQKDASKAIEVVDRIDKYIDENVANAHDMKDSNPDKKYYRGWDDALCEMARILQDVYSNEKQKEQKPMSILTKDDSTFTAYCKGQNDVIENPEAYGLCKQAEWSEEDEVNLGDIKCALYDYYGEERAEELYNMLKSLRPVKQQWSEEDWELLDEMKDYLMSMCYSRDLSPNHIYEGFIDLIDKLKSFRSSPKSSDNWKPSKEQMDALNYFIKLWGNSDDQLEYTKIFNLVKSLHDNLKKLM